VAPVTRTPARGLLLIKKPALADSVNGIVLLDKTKEGWTTGQAEVLAIGPPAYAEEDDEDQIDGVIPMDPRVKVGSWVLTKFRTWVETDVAGEYVIRQSDVLAVLG
jgi:co-chaperonin GroES (HSP10)